MQPEDRGRTGITQLLLDWRQGNAGALDRLTPLIYDELRRMAASQLRRERSDHTLQPTALVNELYMQLAGVAKLEWRDRAHFLGISSYLMRQILVQHARGRSAAKRGGGARKLTLDEALATPGDGGDADLIALDDALRELAAFDERKSRIIEMHYFGGLKSDEMAEVLGISVSTVGREMKVAHAWLHRQVSRNSAAPDV